MADSAKGPFYILSIDGGGIRGAFPAQILKHLEKKLGNSLADNLDMVSGTSTGSILAAAVAARIPLDKVVTMYETKGPVIFNREGIGAVLGLMGSAFKSVYGNEHLNDMLTSVLHQTALSDIKLPLLMPASDICKSKGKVFKSQYLPEIDEDKDILLKDAVLASCSAPIYFDPTEIKGSLYTDGGLWANNSSLVAMLEAQKVLKVSLDDIYLISVGVGYPKEAYTPDADKQWGVFAGWQSTKAIELVMALQADVIDFCVSQMINPSHYLRVDFAAQKSLPIDDCSIIPHLEEEADKWFEANSEKVEEFFSHKK